MPIYEFICSDCRAKFDKLTSFDWKSAGIACPECESDKVIQAVSCIGAFKSDGQAVMMGGDSACNSCHTGSCSTCH